MNVSDSLPAAADLPAGPRVSSPFGLHRVLEPTGARITLPQAAHASTRAPSCGPTRCASRSTRSTSTPRATGSSPEVHTGTGGVLDGAALRDEVLDIVATRGKMQNPVTGSGGMLIGTVEEVGPQSPLGLAVGDRVATLVSLSLTPLQITDGLAGWDGMSEQVPADGHAILFGRSIAARLPDDLDPRLSLMVMDVCGAPALVARVVGEYAARGVTPTVAVLGGGGQVGLPLAGGGPPGRCGAHHRRRAR